jgi:tRNA threonylcarbamoyladenosine modification (KEOPS) complex  Pcc1 subunit
MKFIEDLTEEQKQQIPAAATFDMEKQAAQRSMMEMDLHEAQLRIQDLQSLRAYRENILRIEQARLEMLERQAKAMERIAEALLKR